MKKEEAVIINNQNNTITKLAETALLAALCYVAFTFLQIKIPVPGGDASSIHIGNAFCVLWALLLGESYFSQLPPVLLFFYLNPFSRFSRPVYTVRPPEDGFLSAPGEPHCISLQQESLILLHWQMLPLRSSVAGLAFNVVADPVVGYFYKQYIAHRFQ